MSEDLHKGAEGHLFWYARTNRKEFTTAEHVLWTALRGRQLDGFKFRRQHPINDFIADFYCHERKLVIELDGRYHEERSQVEYDEGRTFELMEHGVTVVRFSNDEVMNSLPLVLNKLKLLLSTKRQVAHIPFSFRRRGRG